jgi:chemotaxis protein MotB
MADCPKCEAGLPPWLATFADLMSLLMCFFVLLLSFASIDAIRFKRMADSMKDAFGVQQESPATDIVRGVSVIKTEWSPSAAEPSIVNEIHQQTTDTRKEYLEMRDGQSQYELTEQQIMREAREIIEKDLAEQFEELKSSLHEELEEGLVVIEKEGQRIKIRIREKGSFPSGSARLDPGFYDVLERISKVLSAKPGQVVVAGHTDNVPINTGRFRSNWELSSARAVTVLHGLLRDTTMHPSRVLVQGFADTRPIASNDTAEDRAQNRRVELVLLRGDEQGTADLEDLLRASQ